MSNPNNFLYIHFEIEDKQFRVVLICQKSEIPCSHPLELFSMMKNLSCKIFRNIEQYLLVAQEPPMFCM